MIKEQFRKHRLSNSLIWETHYFPEITGMDFVKASAKYKDDPTLLLWAYAAMRFAGDPELMGKDPRFCANDIIGEVELTDLTDPDGEFLAVMTRLFNEMSDGSKKK